MVTPVLRLFAFHFAKNRAWCQLQGLSVAQQSCLRDNGVQEWSYDDGK
jgi:hypothetical protein